MAADRPDTAPYIRLSNGETAPVGLWLAASITFGRAIPDNEPYPCRCSEPMGCERRKKDLDRCPCNGRADIDHLRQRCCAVRRAGIRRLSREDRYL